MKTLLVQIIALAFGVSAQATDLSKQIAGLGDKLGEIVIRETLGIPDDLTVPENITLQFQPGGSLNIAEGNTLTIQGGIMAGPSEFSLVRAE